jgi:hypothetical protein
VMDTMTSLISKFLPHEQLAALTDLQLNKLKRIVKTFENSINNFTRSNSATTSYRIATTWIQYSFNLS